MKRITQIIIGLMFITSGTSSAFAQSGDKIVEQRLKMTNTSSADQKN
ncbi:MAG: hypothetical protein ABJA66_15960 [Actinomycetota bacterium]